MGKSRRKKRNQPQTLRQQLKKWLIIVGIVIAGIAGYAWHWDSTTAAKYVHVNPSNIFVSDNAHLLTKSTANTILAYNHELAAMQTQPQLMVVTVNALPFGKSIEDFTVNLATNLGVGSAKYDSGVVYLLAKRERQARLEVGYGMEADIPDGMTDIITDERVKNLYRAGKYDAGIRIVTQRIYSLINATRGAGTHVDAQAVAATAAQNYDSSAGTWWRNLGEWLAAILLVAAFAGLLYLITSSAAWLLARLRYQRIRRAYRRDLVRVYGELHLTPPADLDFFDANTTNADLITVRRSLRTQMRKTPPDYFSFNFAFGSLDFTRFRKQKVRGTSVYHNHKHSFGWYAHSDGNGGTSGGGFGGGGFGGGGGTSSW